MAGDGAHWRWLRPLTAPLLLTAACGDSPRKEREGPALPPRAVEQICLANLSEMPQLLSETGCFENLETLVPAPDLIPYSLNSPLWTDGAFKLRQMMVPPQTYITINEDGSWEFPQGSVLIKSFGFQFQAGDPESRKVIETRFMRMGEEDWEFASYRWNAEGTEASLFTEQSSETISIQDNGEVIEFDYVFPNLVGCQTCHGSEPAIALGPNTKQLNKDHDYDGLVENQLLAMDSIGLFTSPLSSAPGELPRLANPIEKIGSTAEQARAYLEANCSHCHKPEGWASNSTNLDLRSEVSLEETKLCSPMRNFQWSGIPRILPGDAKASGLFQRMSEEGIFRMPSISSSLVDPIGLTAVENWIDELEECPES